MPPRVSLVLTTSPIRDGIIETRLQTLYGVYINIQYMTFEFIYLCESLYICMYICVCVFVCARACVCVRACMHTCMLAGSIIHISTYILCVRFPKKNKIGIEEIS